MTKQIYLGPISIRFGIQQHPLFSERYQGQRGIPKRFFYLFGKRITIIRRAQRLEKGNQ